MNTITREELKTRLEQHKPTQLVMTLGKWGFEQMHIPGSMQLDDFREAAQKLSREQDVVIYCTNPACPACYRAYYQLKNLGYNQIKHFSGGLEAWMEAGLPVEGSLTAAAA